MAGWSEERKQLASEAAKARLSAKMVATAPNEMEPIVTPAPVEESPVFVTTETPLLDAKPDLSKLNDDDKMQSLINLLKVLPSQYMMDDAMAKENIWRIARFEPTTEQLARAKEAIENEPKRTPR